MKVTTIKESKDLSEIGINELIVSLLTYEMKRKHKNDEKKDKMEIALRVIDKEGDEDSLIDEEDISLLVKKFNKFHSRSKRNKSKNVTRNRNKEDDDKDLEFFIIQLI